MDDAFYDAIASLGFLSPFIGVYLWMKIESLPDKELESEIQQALRVAAVNREVPFDPDLAAAGLIQPEFIEVRSIRTEYHEIRTKNPPQAAFIYEMGSRAPVELDYDVVDVIPRQVQVIEKRLVWRSVF